MSRTDSKYLIDSSAWISYFFAENDEVKNIIENSNILMTSAISIFEIKRKIIKDKFDANKISNILSFIRKKSIIINIVQEISEKAAEFSVKEKLHAMDSLIYASALINNCTLVSLDNDFKNLDKVIYL